MQLFFCISCQSHHTNWFSPYCFFNLVTQTAHEAKVKKTVERKKKPAVAKKPTVAKKTKKTKKVVDANAPKKPLSGFMKFSQEHRAAVKEENPELAFGAVGKKLGEMWRALSAKEKAAYKPDKSLTDSAIESMDATLVTPAA